MDVTKIISDLHTELEQIEKDIDSLERSDTGPTSAVGESSEEIGQSSGGSLEATLPC